MWGYDFDYYSGDLREFLPTLAKRPGMFVGRTRFDLVDSLLQGIMMTRGRKEEVRFREWLIADLRRKTGSGSPLGSSSILLDELFPDHRPSPHHAPGPEALSADEHQTAIEYLCRRLAEFLDAEEAEAPGPTSE